jgi:hypothetical protein
MQGHQLNSKWKMEVSAATPKTGKALLYLKKLGWIGFFFFLIKGLFWLALLWFAKEQIN